MPADRDGQPSVRIHPLLSGRYKTWLVAVLLIVSSLTDAEVTGDVII